MNASQPTQSNIRGLVFSKDRAMQLQAVLDSLRLHLRDPQAMRLAVLFRASSPRVGDQYRRLRTRYPDVAFVEETDFRSQVLSLIRPSEMVLFAVDDNLFVRDFSIGDICAALAAHPDAIGFSLRLGRNIHRCYMRDVPPAQPAFIPAAPEIVKFSWPGAPHDFGYPLEVSSSLYRTAELLALLEQLPFTNPNTLEGLMAANAQLYAAARPGLLCFEQSVAFCNPVNLVQTVCPNRNGADPAYSVQRLSDLFDQGHSIDVTLYSGFVPQACHQEAELVFRGGTETKPSPPHRPLVTVEMAAYNAAGHIRRAIESILAQDYEPFELLVVDDGSTDDTAAIVAEYRDPRIRSIHQDHANYAAARNRAIGEAKGHYLLVVDSDDTIAPGYIQAMVAHAEQNPGADYYYPAGLTLVDDAGRPTGVVWRYEEIRDSRVLIAVLFTLGKSVIPEPGSLVRRSLYERTGLYRPVETAADFDFLCRNAGQMRFSRVAGSMPYYYRVGSGGLSRKYQQRNEITAAALEEMISRYPAEILYPQLAQVSDPAERTCRFHEYLMMTFYSHAQTNAGRFSEPFRQRGDRYRTLMIESLTKTGRLSQSVWSMTGNQRPLELFRCAVDRLRSGRPDEALVYMDETRSGGFEMSGLDYARAVAFVQLGRNDQAIAACRAELNRRPNPDAEQLLTQLGQWASLEPSVSPNQTANPSIVSTT